MVTHMKSGLVSKWSSTSSERGPSTPQFWGSLLFVRTPFAATTKFDVVTYAGEVRVSWRYSHASHRRGRSSSALQSWGFSCIYAYAFFNAERPNSAW